MGRVLGLKNYSQVGVKPWGLDNELAAWWWKNRSLSNGQNIEHSTERIKVLSPGYFTFNIFKKCIYVHFIYICLFVYMYLVLYLHMSQCTYGGERTNCWNLFFPATIRVMWIKSRLSNLVASTLTWWVIIPSPHCTLNEKNIDAINWILQFILKLNFYVLTNAKCQLYSNKW